MLISWARAEAPARWRSLHPPHVGKLERGEPLDGHERVEVALFMARTRKEAACLLGGATSWYVAGLRIGACGDLLLDPFWTWAALGFGGGGPGRPWDAPHPRTVADLAAHASAPPLTIDGEFRFERMRGAPICITSRLDGPLRLVEGSNRARAIWRARSVGLPTPELVEILIGVHPDPDAFKYGHVCQALASIGWTRDGSRHALLVRRDDPGRPYVLACPETRRATPLASHVFEAFTLIGFPEVATLEGADWVFDAATA